MVAIVTGNGLGLQSSSALGLGARGQVGSATFGQTGEQIYVNAANGNLVIQDRDQLLLGQGGNASVNRAYNSLGQFAGDNWRPGGSRKVDDLTGTLNSAGSKVTLTDWDGSTTVYQYDASRNVYVSTGPIGVSVAQGDFKPGYSDVTSAGAHATLSFDAATHSWQWSDGSKQLNETYDANHGGRLVASRDRDGNTVTYAYNAAGQLAQVSTAGGDVTYLDYNAAGQLTELRSVYRGMGNNLVTSTAIRYAYDTQGRLSQVITDLSPEDNSIGDGRVFTTTYTYDGTSSRIASVTQSDGSQMAFTYLQVNGEYRVATIAEKADNGVVRLTSLSYDTAKNQTTVTDPLGYRQVWTYDSAGRLTNIKSTSTVDGQSENRSFGYDANGNLSLLNDGRGKTISFVYDAAGNLIKQSEKAADITRAYGANNELLTETNREQMPSTEYGFQSQYSTTRYVYDVAGHLRYVVSAEGRVTEFRYNATGQRVSEIHYTAAAFDISAMSQTGGALSETVMNAWASGPANPGQAIRIDSTYDYRGNVATVTRYESLLADGSGDAAAAIAQTRYVYDAAGRLLQRFAGKPGNEQVEAFTYDGLGRLLSTVQFDGAITLYQYDDAHHTVSVLFSNGLTRTSTYNAAGELTAVVESVQGRVQSQIRNYYDPNGRLRMSTDANGLNTHYLYNGRGQCVAQIGPDGTLTEYVYDSLAVKPQRTVTYATRLTIAQLASLTKADGTPAITLTSGVVLTLESSKLRPAASVNDRSVWAFYLNNFIDHTVDADGNVTQIEYDGSGRPVVKTVFANRVDTSTSPAQQLPVADPANDRVTRYFYDQEELLRGELDPEGYLTEYRYNGAGERVETIRYATPTDVLLRKQGTFGQLIPIGNAADMHVSYVYDSRGLLRAEVDAEGYVTSYQYDALGNVVERIQGRRVDRSLLDAPQQLPLSFRAAATAAATVEIWVDGVLAGKVTVAASTGMDYTVSVSSIIPLANHTIEFRFPTSRPVSITDVTLGDEVRMRIPVTPGKVGTTQFGVRYTFDMATALAAAMVPGELQRTTYAYDPMGRLIGRTIWTIDGVTETDYTYDQQGNVTRESTGDRASTYRYDAQGRLIAQLGGEGSAALVALGASATQGQVDSLWKTFGVSYAYDAAGHRTSMTDANGNATFYYYDASGQLTHIVNPMGEVVEYQYDAFGDVTQTLAYATRVAAGTLASLTGGLLSDSLRSAFAALGNDGDVTRTTFSYSAAGRLVQRTDALGLNTRYTYNTFGEQISSVQDIAPTVQVLDATDYDRLGHAIRQTTDAGGLNLITQAVYDAFGRVVESVDANGVLRRQTYDRNGNVIVVTDGAGTQSRMSYDAFGNVLTRTDANGNTTTWSYAAFNRTVTVTTAEGIKTTSSYNESGQVVTLTDGRDNTTHYSYDRHGNLLGTVDATGATTALGYDHAGHLIDTVDARGVHTTYSYDAAGRVLTRSLDPSGLNLTTRYEYDAKGQATRVTDPSGVITETRYDAGGHAIAVTTDAGGLNLLTTFTYDGLGNVVTVTEGAGSSNPRVTLNVYDSAGRLTGTIVDPAGLGLTTNYVYDSNGNVVAVTDAAGGVTRYVYDAEGRQTWVVGPTGALVNNAYDAGGRVVSRTAFALALASGELPPIVSDAYIAERLMLQPSHDQTTQYVYDADGRIRYVVNALNYITENVYDANGNVIRTVAYASPVMLQGKIAIDAVTQALAGQATQSEDRATRRVYDAANRLTATIDAIGYVTYNRFDAGGNLVERTQYQTAYPGMDNPDASALQLWLTSPAVAQPASDRTTTWIYDAGARPAYVIDAEGYITENRYDGAGQLLVAIRYADPYEAARGASQAQAAALLPQTIPATAAATRYDYDGAGRLTGSADATGVATRYELDSMGRAVNTIVADGQPEQSVTHAVFDAAGRMVEQTRAYGSPVAATSRYTYDGTGRVIAEIDPRGVELAEQDTSWALAERKSRGYVDANGEALEAAALSPDQKASLLALYRTSYAYNERGDLLRTTDALGYALTSTYDAFGNRVAASDQNGNVTRFAYDALNRATQVISPTGSYVVTDYDAFGDTIRVTQDASAVTRMEYDRLGRLVKATDAMGYSELYAYDGFGNRTGYTNKVGGRFAYTYDRRGLMLSETLPVTTRGGPVVNAFEYDARGNRITTIEARGLTEQRITRFAYDLLDRQITMTGVSVYQAGFPASTTETQRYDARGNLTSLTDANGHTTAWYYDAANRKTAQVDPTGTLTQWTYDAAGNVTVTRVYADPVGAAAGLQAPVPVDADRVRETRYVYDADNRLTASRVLNVATGYFNPDAGADQRGEYSITSGSDLVSTWEYDGCGRVTVATDQSGNRTMYFYDAGGNRTLEIDAIGFGDDVQGYGIAYTVDARGNVTQEIRFALRYPDPFSVRSSASLMVDAWPRSQDDRITTYTYDENGRLLGESRMNVQFATVDANGKLVQSSGNATTTYAYDGEGHLVRKIDANGSQYDFTYDALGHLTAEMLPQFADYLGRQVRVTTLFEHDGLNNVIKETRKGESDQVTSYLYDAGGRLHSKINALGVATNFRYDATGNVTQVFYLRSDADGHRWLDSTTIAYDAQNREVSRITRTSDAATGAQVSAGALIEQRYNAFGELTGRRTGGSVANSEWQEYADYNNAGWVVRTNFNDGVSHLFLYDRNGNATLKIESMETDLRYQVIATGQDLEALLQKIDMMQTYTRYDARNQVIQIRQPKTSGSAPRISFSPVDIPIDGGVFANTQLSIGGWLQPNERLVSGPVQQLAGGDAGIVGGKVEAGVTVNWSSSSSVEIDSLSLSVPGIQAAYGAYDLSAVVTYRAWGNRWSGGPNNQSTSVPFDTGTVTLPALMTIAEGDATLNVPLRLGFATYNSYYAYATGPVNFEYTVQLYLTPRDQIAAPQPIGTISKSAKLYDVNGENIYRAPSNVLNSAVSLNVQGNSLTVAHGTLPAGAQGMLYYRQAGSSGAFQQIANSQGSQPNSYSADVGSLPDGDYEMIFIAASDGEDGRAPNTLLRRDSYVVHLDRVGTSGSRVEQTALPYDEASTRPGLSVDSTGTYIWSAPQILNVYSPVDSAGNLVDHFVARVRGSGGTAWDQTFPVFRDPGTGALRVDLSGLGPGRYDVEFDLYDAAGTLMTTTRSKVIFADGEPPSFGFAYVSDFTSTVVFHTQPADTDHLVVSWVQDGETKYATVGRSGDNEFSWDTLAGGLIPDLRFAYTYDIKFTAYDAFGRPLSMGQGEITVQIGGADDTVQATLTGSSLPCIFEFTPMGNDGQPVANVDSLTLYYRESVLEDGDYERPFTEVTIWRDPAGRFLFDATALPTNTEYEYRYIAKDAAANVLMERESYFLTGTRNNPVTNVDIVGVIEQTTKDMTIDRLEHYNAFGEVSAERTGTGYWTYLSYNTMGMLTLKREPTVSVTLTNGAQIDIAPETSFYYDLTGNLLGLKDANGNLSTQQWSYGLAQPAVAKSWDAMGYSKISQYDSVGNLRVSTDELNRRTDYTYDKGNRLIQIARPVLANGQRSIDRYEYDSAGNRIGHTDALGGRERTYYDSDGRIVRTVSAAGREVRYDYRWATTISSLGTVASGGWIKTTTDANGMTMVDQTDLFGRLMMHADLGGHVFQYTYNWAGLLTHQGGTSGQDVDYTYYSHGMVRSIVDNASKTQSLYEYDGDGNRTAEFFQSFGDVYKFAQATVEYDALGRVTSINDDTYKVFYEYDAVGNRRRMFAEYTDMVGYHTTNQEYWYEYDALNRFTVSMGSLSGVRAVDANDASVSIVMGAAGGEGVQLGYNAAGERMIATYVADGRTERYAYDANGYLTTQTINGVVAQERTNDLLGRVTEFVERDVKSGQKVTDTTRTWDADSQQTSGRDNLEQATTTYTRMADGTLKAVDLTPDDPNNTRTTYTYEYEWWDGAKQSKVTGQGSNPTAPGWKPASSYFNYDVNGNLKSTYDDGGGDPGNARAFMYWTDLRGQVQRRDELTGVTVDANGTINGATGDRKHNYYYLNGNRVGNQGNDGIDNVDYVQELAGKLGKGSDNQFKVFSPVSTADFDENYMAINGAYPGVSPGQWTVRDGDTLQSVASALWGDSTLWYILADANGLKSDDVLKAGQMLTVPNKVTNVHNTATTFKPYDPGKAIGDTQPTLPDPPPPPGMGEGCGAMLPIIAIVVAVVATIVTAGAAAMALGAVASSAGVFGAGTAVLTGGLAGAGITTGMGLAAAGAAALGGAVGAIASQGVMIASGAQSGFDWKGVALGAVAAGVGSGVGQALRGVGLAAQLSQSGQIGQVGLGATLGAGTSGASQGIGALTGLQHSFDWKGMAAGAIAGGVGTAVGQTALGQIPVLGNVAARVAAGSAGTLVRGGSLGRNVGAITADAIASTIGNMVVSQVQAQSVGKTGTPSTNGNGSMSALYGVGGNYDDLVRQSYNVNAGEQFAGIANWDLALSATAVAGGAAGYAGGTISPYGGTAFNVEQARMQRIADMQLDAVNPAIVHAAPALGELNVLVTGVGSRYDPDGYPLPNAGSAASMAKAAGSWLDTPIGALENLSQTVLKGNAIMAEGLDAVGLHGLASAQMGLGQIISSSVPTRPWEVALSAAPLAGEVGPAMRAGAAMFGPKLGGWAESYAAKSGILLYVSDNVSVGPVGEIGASTGSRQGGFIFRGDGRAPDVIFETGLQPKGPNQDLYRYAAENVDSVFVSTSKSPNIAREFASYQGDGYVYTIRGQSAGVDVNAVLGNRSPFPHEMEVAVPGGVRPTDIMGGRLVGPDGTFIGPFIKNPGYTR
ncbi:scabin-related ADP-ribosyltransferase [Paraburkholderia metrosideri]|uniref:LysM domain-containing protein n=1 Tax=Paraburkholderia metrosideri TaxID=580937 RepID=A0ABN7I1V4_9BURK|nr:LysM peptidoglycan-binding domain-containing protein [Paraburkholderia metrosideri]CAD6548971.1 hypothetical protein LMG28140_04688 [Paraburkholderia metrosideri]